MNVKKNWCQFSNSWAVDRSVVSQGYHQTVGRGLKVEDLEPPIEVPVGKATLGRTGNVRDTY